MVNFFIRAFIISSLISLVACGGDAVSTESSVNSGPSGITPEEPIDDSGDNEEPADDSGGSMSELAKLGETFYMSAEQGCSGCHAADGKSAVFKLIDLGAESFEHSSNPGTLVPAVEYVESYMKPSNPSQCVGDCAAAVVAFMDYLAGDNGSESEKPENTVASAAASPLSRLTNNEYVNSIRGLLNLPADSANINVAVSLMAAETTVKGLANDSDSQSFSTATMAGYIDVAEAAADDLIGDASTLEALEDILQCDELQQTFSRRNYNSRTCFRDFSRLLTSEAYGQPYTSDSEDLSLYFQNIETYLTDAGLEVFSVEALQFRLRVMLPYVFASPDFLLFVETGEAELVSDEVSGRYLSSPEIAKRMAFFLTGALPDAELTAAAEAGLLLDPAVRLEHAERLLADDAVADQFADFFVGWLGVSIAADQVTQNDVDKLKGFLIDWFANDRSFNELYTGPVDVLNADDSTTTMNLGVLGTKAFVASHTNNPVPSFINRGEFITTRLLCANLPDDIPSAAFEESSVVAETSTELFHELKTHDCASCHQVFDNYGALFQQFNQQDSLFDAALKPYGGSFNVASIGDITGEFDSIETFSQSLGGSQTAAQCASELIYRHSVRRSLNTDGEDDVALASMFDTWSNSGDFSVKSLLKTIIVSDNFVIFFEFAFTVLV